MDEVLTLQMLGAILGVGALSIYTLVVLPERFAETETGSKSRYLPLIAGGLGLVSLMMTLFFVGMGEGWTAEEDAPLTVQLMLNLGLSFVLILTVGASLVSQNRSLTTIAMLCSVTLGGVFVLWSRAWMSGGVLLVFSAVLWFSWSRSRSRSSDAPASEGRAGSEPFLTCVIATVLVITLIGGSQSTLLEHAAQTSPGESGKQTEASAKEEENSALLFLLMSVCLIAVGAGSLVLWRTNRTLPEGTGV